MKQATRETFRKFTAPYEEHVTIAPGLAAQDVANHVMRWPTEHVAGYRYDRESGALTVTFRGDQ